MHVPAFTPHQCSFVRACIRDDPVYNHMRVLSPDACNTETSTHPRMRRVSWGQSAQTTTRDAGFAILRMNTH